MAHVVRFPLRRFNHCKEINFISPVISGISRSNRRGGMELDAAWPSVNPAPDFRLKVVTIMVSKKRKIDSMSIATMEAPVLTDAELDRLILQDLEVSEERKSIVDKGYFDALIRFYKHPDPAKKLLVKEDDDTSIWWRKDATFICKVVLSLLQKKEWEPHFFEVGREVELKGMSDIISHPRFKKDSKDRMDGLRTVPDPVTGEATFTPATLMWRVKNILRILASKHSFQLPEWAIPPERTEKVQGTGEKVGDYLPNKKEIIDKVKGK